MEPINFEGANVVYGVNQPEYTPLPAECIWNREAGQINTCWKLSTEELERVKETGVIWLSVLTFGKPLQPVLLSVDKPEAYDIEESKK